jgi:hypothetical protein
MNKSIPLLVLALGAISHAYGDGHENSWRGVDLDRQFGMQFEVCALNPGKTMADVEKLDKEASEQFRTNGLELSLMRMTPMFRHGMPGDSKVSYINVVMGAIPAFGSGWDNWMASKSAQKLMAEAGDVATCNFKFARAINRMAKTDALDETDNRLISMNWCAKRENISWDQLRAKHNAWQAAYEEGSSAMAWNIVLPRLGSGEVDADYMHMVSYANAKQLMANEEWVANEGGGAALGDYYSAYANCNGESIWNATYVHKHDG